MELRVATTPYGVNLTCPEWDEFALGPLRTFVHMDGNEYPLRAYPRGQGSGEWTMLLGATGAPVTLEQHWRPVDGGWLVASSLHVTAKEPVTLNAVELLALRPRSRLRLAHAERLRVLEQGRYWGHVMPMFPAEGTSEGTSELCWVMADEQTGMSFFAGFETARRWLGTIRARRLSNGTLTDWVLGFDGGDLLLEPEETVELEDVLLLVGPDAWELLNRYGERVRERHKPRILSESPVSWCSWYPYRLGVSEERVLANARIAAERLAPLRLKIMEVDLGWQRGHLPNAFEENDRFPHGLRGLADELEKLGFVLGVWAAPTSISGMSELAREHPEWLVRDEDGLPHNAGEWYWEPHGPVYILDVTHPEAQNWLRERIRSLAERGARYLKADFISNLGNPAAKRRHDRRIVAGGGTETGHIAARIMREALREGHPEALYLSCGGPELPGPSQGDLIYTCDDTGNTGYVGWEHLRKVTISVATHLFKHRRWGIIQPSCLCVGLPGTLAEARLRATMAFMSGGEINISDDLTTLPEDRWRVLTATLPPYGRAARPVDLFQPIGRVKGTYGTQGTHTPQEELPPAPPGSVWALPIETRWDRWTLVAVFDYGEEDAQGTACLHTYLLPIARLGLSPEDDLWVYEFWSGQFCGCLPADVPPPPEYTHPGDIQMPVSRPEMGTIAVSFFGPGIMLLAVRPRKPYPWVVGTGFHQSCGLELTDVRWNEETKTLSGELRRPVGESGTISIAGFGRSTVRAQADGHPLPVHSGARGSAVVPITVARELTRWEMHIE